MRSLFCCGSESCNTSRIRNQFLATLGVALLHTQAGIIGSWASPNIAKLMKPDSPIPLTEDEASWLAAVSHLSFIGSVTGVLSNVYIGGKKTILASYVTICVSWVCLIAANSVEWLYAARFLAGVGTGLSSISSLYLGEILSAESRGSFIAFAAFGAIFGGIAGIVIETYVAMRVSSSIYMAHGLIGLALFVFLMDSPYYFVKKGNQEKARESLVFYDKLCDSSAKLTEINNYLVNMNKTLWQKMKEFTTLAARKSMLLIVLLFTLPSFSGVTIFGSYMEVIINKSQSNLMESKVFVIVASIFTIVLLVLTYRLIDKIGRKTVLLMSSTGTSIGMIGLSTHFFLLNEVDIQYISWLPLVSVMIAVSFYIIGMVSIPNTVLSEIFSDNTKSIAACVAYILSSLASFTSTKTYQPMVDTIGERYTFLIYAMITLLLVPSALFLMIETRGKTIQQIQSDLERKNNDAAVESTSGVDDVDETKS